MSDDVSRPNQATGQLFMGSGIGASCIFPFRFLWQPVSKSVTALVQPLDEPLRVLPRHVLDGLLRPWKSLGFSPIVACQSACVTSVTLI